MSAAIVAAVVGAGAMVYSSSRASSEAKKNRAAQQQAEARQMELAKDDRERLYELSLKLPEQEKQAIGEIMATYVNLEAQLNQARIEGDELTIKAFESQRDLIETSFKTEIEAIGLQFDEFNEAALVMSDAAVKLVNSDADVNARFKEEYAKDSEKAVENLGKLSDIIDKRLDSHMANGGLPEGASADLANMRQGLADIKRQTKNLESAIGKGGSASRKSAVALEGVKAIGEATSALRKQGAEELKELSETARLLGKDTAAIAGARYDVMEETRGRDELAATQPFRQQQLLAIDRKGSQELQAITNKNTQLRQADSLRGSLEIQRAEDEAALRAQLTSSRAAQEAAVRERTQDKEAQFVSGQIGISNSMADILSVQSQNYANQAAQARAASQQSFAQLGTLAAGGIQGYAQSGTLKGAGLGAIQGWSGQKINTGPNVKNTNSNLNNLFGEV